MNPKIDAYQYTKNRIGPFRCRNCNGIGYYDYVAQKDICDYCENPDLDKGKGQEIDSIAAEAITCCASGELKRADQLVRECREKNRKVVPTRLAEISLAVARGGSQSKQEALALIDKFMKTDGMIDAEENRFFITLRSHNDSDALALLMSVYKLIASQFDRVEEADKSDDFEQRVMMEQRAQICYDMLIPESLSTSIGRNIVLVQALENGDWARARTIVLTNVPCKNGRIFKGRALKLILSHYPPEEDKEQLLTRIADKNALEQISAEWMSEYFRTTRDPISIRMKMARCSAGTPAFSGIGLVKYLLPDVKTEGYEKELFEVVCNAPGQDKQKEVFRYLLGNRMVNEMNELLDAMQKASHRPYLESELFRDFLLSTDLAGEEKASVVQRIMAMPSATLLKRGIMEIYLCEADDRAEERLKVIDVLLTPKYPINPRIGENYILHCNQDKENKARIVQKMVSLGFRILSPDSFCNRYLTESVDDENTRKQILTVLNLRKELFRDIKNQARFRFW